MRNDLHSEGNRYAAHNIIRGERKCEKISTCINVSTGMRSQTNFMKLITNIIIIALLRKLIPFGVRMSGEAFNDF